MDLSRDKLPAATRSVSQKLHKSSNATPDPVDRKRYLKQLLAKPSVVGLRHNESVDHIVKMSTTGTNRTPKQITPRLGQRQQEAGSRGSLVLADRLLPGKLRTRRPEMEIIGRNLTGREIPTKTAPTNTSLDGSLDKMPSLVQKQSVEGRREKQAKLQMEAVKHSPSVSVLLKPVMHRPSLQAVLKVGEEILNNSIDHSKDRLSKPTTVIHRKSGSGTAVIEKIAEKISLQNKLVTKPLYRGSLIAAKPTLVTESTGLIDISGVSHLDHIQQITPSGLGLQPVAKRHSTLKQPFATLVNRVGGAGPVRSLQLSGEIAAPVCPATAPAQVAAVTPRPGHPSQSTAAAPTQRSIQDVLQGLCLKKQTLQGPPRTRGHKRAASDIHESAGRLLQFGMCSEEKLEDLGTGRGGSLVRLKAGAKNAARLMLPSHSRPAEDRITEKRVAEHSQKPQNTSDVVQTEIPAQAGSWKANHHRSGTTLATERTSGSELCSWLLSDPLTSMITAWPRSADPVGPGVPDKRLQN